MPTLPKPSGPKKIPYRKQYFDPSEIYQSLRWDVMRKWFHVNRPLCTPCLVEGKSKLFKELHHIIPFSQGHSFEEVEQLAFDYENVFGCCIEHHHLFHDLIKDDPVSYYRLIENIKGFLRANNIYM